MKDYIDRGEPLQGINRTLRDSRLPYSLARSMDNFSMPDSRLRRRKGFDAMVGDTPNGRNQGNMLAKHTGSTIVARSGTPHLDGKSAIYKTPLSYGVLHYHSDFKLSILSPWTREFVLRLGDKESLVTTPFKRVAYKAGSGTTFDWQMRTAGVYVLDQTLLANAIMFDKGTVASADAQKTLDPDHTAATGDATHHSVPLTTMAISYTETHIQVEMGIVTKNTSGLYSTAGVYFPREINLLYAFPATTYEVGDTYHVAVRNDVSGSAIELLIDGVVVDSYTVSGAVLSNYEIIGAYDLINGETYSGGLGRDIVLLNECTVRGPYQSTNKIQTYMNQSYTFFQSYNSVSLTTDQPPAPWCCSPPRGTAMRALRLWGDLRSTAEILANSKTDALTDSGNLLGLWDLSAGSSVIEQNGGSTTGADIVLCHGYPSYISRAFFLHKLGLRLADGQHIIFSTSELAHKYIQDASLPMISAFGWEARENGVASSPYGNRLDNTGFDDIERIKEQHNVTVQIQFETPAAFQLELNKATTGSAFLTEDLGDAYAHKLVISNRETRRSMRGTHADNFNSLMIGASVFDGGHFKSGSATYIANLVFDGRQINTIANSGDTDWVANNDGAYFFRAYDQCLFSIEGMGEDHPDETDNYGSRTRVPLMKGLITPEGKLAFEIFLAGDTNEVTESATYRIGGGWATAACHRVIGETVLTPNNIYTVTFVKRATTNPDSGRPGAVIDVAPSGQQFEIWLQDVSGEGDAVLEYSATLYKREIVNRSITSLTRQATSPPVWRAVMAAAHGLTTAAKIKCELRGVVSSADPTNNYNGCYDCEVINSTTIDIKTINPLSGTLAANGVGMWLHFDGALRSSFMRHKPVYDVIVGAAGVNHHFDNTTHMPQSWFSSTKFGPWSVPQRFMSPYQDQPANISVSFFRLWAGVALEAGDIDSFGDRELSTKEYSPHLVINAEIQENAGDKILNKCRYPGFLNTGYKSWGTPPSAPFVTKLFPALQPWTSDSQIPGAWMMEDCLGYMPHKAGDLVYYTGRNAECNGLASFQTTLTQSYGLLVVFDDNLSLDGALDGNYQNLHFTGHGLLNDFAAKGRWMGTSIGDRTILTSDTGLPKVFNGKNAVVAGFKRWTGGMPIITSYEHTTVTEGLLGRRSGEGDAYYGWRVVYNAEEYSLQHMSDTYILKVPESDNGHVAIVLDIPAHYDPRITSITIYRTRLQETRSLALSTELFPIFSGALANIYHPSVEVNDLDQNLIPAPLDRFRTEIPICRYSAAVNGRLYLAGNVAIPDAVYFSVAGNPETFDVLEQVMILEEGSGDRVTGMIAMFGILFVFKANSVWRIEEVGAGQHQINQIASVGPAGEDSLEVFTLPDSGRTAIFFWSQYGPYMLDGSVVQYIGTGIEDNGDHDEAEYDWLSPQSVMTLHDIQNKEIICFYKRAGDDLGGVTEARRSEAIVFNYRFQTWYRFTSVFAHYAISGSFTGNAYTLATLGGSEDEGIQAAYENIAVALIGGTNGWVYKWGETDNDGRPLNVNTPDLTTTVTSFSLGVMTVPAGGGYPVHHFKRLWMTIRSARTGKYITAEITDNTLTTFTIVIKEVNAFTPAPGDTVYLCRAPASIIFPWDMLDIPFKDKQVLDLITWHNKDWFFRMKKDWDDTDIMDHDPDKPHKEWHSLDAPTVANGRSRTKINKKAEAVKLELVSFEIGATLDAFAYHVDYLGDGVAEQ